MNDIIESYNLENLKSKIRSIRKMRYKQYKQYEMYLEKNEISDFAFSEYKKYECCQNQEKLAEKLNLKRQTIISWETGKTYPSIENLIQLCSVFDCNMDYLLGSIETPLIEPVSIAHYFSKISPEIIAYGLKNDDYLTFLNFFMLPENCKPLVDFSKNSTWKNFSIKSALINIKNPLKDDIIKAYDEYSASILFNEPDEREYKEFLKAKFPVQKLIFNKENFENGYKLRACFKTIDYQSFFRGKEFDYEKFIDYLVKSTYKLLIHTPLIESQKLALYKTFIDLFEKYFNI